MTSTPTQAIWEEAQKCDWCGRADYRPVFKVLDKRYVRCEGCGVVRLFDRVRAANLDLLYGQYYQGSQPQLSSAELARQLANPTFDFRRKTLERFAPVGRRQMFEIGCGDGNFLAILRGAGWQVDGCEYARSSVELIRQRHDLKVQTGNFNDLALEPASLWVVGAYHVLEHLYQPREWLASVQNRLQPGGLLHLQLPNMGSLEARLAGAAWGGLIFPQHVYNYNPAQLKAGLGEAGFEVLSLTSYDPWHSPGTTLATLRNLVYRWQGRPVWQLPTADARSDAPAAPAPRPSLLKQIAGLGREVVARTITQGERLVGAGNIIDIVARRI